MAIDSQSALDLQLDYSVCSDTFFGDIGFSLSGIGDIGFSFVNFSIEFRSEKGTACESEL